MSDVETALRAMLQERAADIESLPEHLLETVERAGRRRPPRTVWLVAAAVVVVLAVVGGVLALRGHGRRTAPATPTPRPSTSSTPVPHSHAERQVSLSWPGMQAIPGVEQRLRLSEPGYRMMALRASADHDAPVGCNGCEMASDDVFVIDPGRFAPTRYGVAGWSTTTVGGRPAYLGTMREYGGGRYTVPTLAWEFRPGQWILVQGVTALGGSADMLRQVAAAVRPTQSIPIELPLRLGYVPDLPVTEVMDDSTEGYDLVVRLGSATGRNFTIDVRPVDAGTTVAETAQTERTVGGRPGYYDPARGAADVTLPDTLVEFGLSEYRTGQLTSQDHLDMERVLDTVVWVTTPAEQAIP
ncbi:MAG: hypothetical protein J0H43_04330 [Actinobacteria bacterium]|nr:hypothetical protein [Actinomycetota bacterium]